MCGVKFRIAYSFRCGHSTNSDIENPLNCDSNSITGAFLKACASNSIAISKNILKQALKYFVLNEENSSPGKKPKHDHINTIHELLFRH